MGRYERGLIETKEKHLVSILNGKQNKLLEKELSNKEIEINKNLAVKIRKKFPLHTETEHIGNTYGISLGDVKITNIDRRESLFLEVKYLNIGSGTRANISQDALTKYKIFENAKDWSIFRKEKNHDNWVLERLLKFKNYDNNYSGKSLRVRICHLAKELIQKIKENTKISNEAERIKNSIIEKDRQEKIDYINYLSDKSINRDNLRKFVILILTGNHTEKAFKSFENMKFSEIPIPDNYFNLYVYYNGEVFLEDFRDIVRKIKNTDNKINIEFVEEQTNIKIYITVLANGKKEYLLRVVFNWKNKFQGIETPCLNIFDEYNKEGLLIKL